MTRRALGLWTAAALVVANMVGAGVFTTSGFALDDLGAPRYVVWAWVLGGVFAGCGALCYGGLSRALPESGGEYYFLSRLVHPLAGFLAGWVSLLGGFTAPIAAAALSLQAYLAPALGLKAGANWVGSGAIALAALLHGLRRRRGVLAQNTAVAVKVVVMAAMAGAGLVVVAGRPTPAAAPSATPPFELGAFAVTLVWVSFAYSGWNATTYLAGEVRDPDRNLHRSLLLGTCVVAALYIALNAVFVHAAPVAELAGRADVAAAAAAHLGGDTLVAAVRAVVALASWTSVSAMVMAGPRVYARMAQDGMFPRVFAREVPDGAPRGAVLLQAALAIAVVWISDLQQLLGYIGFLLGLSTAATVMALFVARRQLGRDRVRVFGWPVVPVVFLTGTLGTAGFMIARQPVESAWVGVTLLGGALVYACWRRRVV